MEVSSPNFSAVNERTGALIFAVAYPIAVGLGLAVHPEPPAIDWFFAAPMLFPLSVLFRRFKVSTTGAEFETNELQTNLKAQLSTKACRR